MFAFKISSIIDASKASLQSPMATTLTSSRLICVLS